MSGVQVAALIFAILLLLPGGCFLLAGFSFDAAGLISIGVGIVAIAGFLLWIAFRRRSNPPGQS